MIYYFLVFLLSMIPVLELRFALPFGYLTWNLNLIWTYLISVVGNMVPVPFILLFIPKILSFMKDHHIFPKFTNWIINKGKKGASKIEEESELKEDQKKKIPIGACLALFTFVAIPLPGTGAWTGALVASFFQMKKRYAIPTITLGVLCAGLIVTLILQGVLGFLSFLI